jgi:DNA (cytosine-5)-methyltransferase 1
VLVENVPGLLAHGMADVLGDLAAIGYDAEWDSVPAAFIGAPHIRNRVFIVAYPNSEPVRMRAGDLKPLVWPPIPRHQRPAWPAEPGVGRVAHGVPHRVDRLRGLGNAVVPQVAEHIGKLIMEAAA